MNRLRILLPVALLAAASVALCGCDPDPAPSAPPSSASADPAGAGSDPTTPELALPDDAVLVVDGTVHDAAGELEVRLVVHRSYAWDSPEGAPLAAAMTSGCAGGLDESVYASQLWSFAAIDVTATPTGAAPWPGDPAVPLEHWVTIDPTSQFLALADSGFPLEDPTVDPATPHCTRDRFVPASGSGTLIVGFQGDTDAVGAAGHFTRWANHRYGFSTASGSVADCTFVVTELGASLGGGAPTWAEQRDDTHCVTGTGLPEDTDS